MKTAMQIITPVSTKLQATQLKLKQGYEEAVMTKNKRKVIVLDLVHNPKENIKHNHQLPNGLSTSKK